jgi:ClpP class serine protease
VRHFERRGIRSGLEGVNRSIAAPHFFLKETSRMTEAEEERLVALMNECYPLTGARSVAAPTPVAWAASAPLTQSSQGIDEERLVALMDYYHPLAGTEHGEEPMPLVKGAGSHQPVPARPGSPNSTCETQEDYAHRMVAFMRSVTGAIRSGDEAQLERAIATQMPLTRSSAAAFAEHHPAAAFLDAPDSLLVGPSLGLQLSNLTVTVEQRSEFAKFRAAEGARRTRAREDGNPSALIVQGSKAVVTIRGMLSEFPNIWAWLLGEPNTLYSDIAEAVASAEANPVVTHVTFDIESGGGTVAGLRTATQSIRAMTKARTAVSSFAASAAFWLATQVGRIEAKHDLSEFGSIGVAVRSVKAPNVYDLASSNAPNKRPDPGTDEGKAAIRAELDAIHSKFAGDVAEGRSRATGRIVTVEQVNATYGRGGMVMAEDALARGMIDAVGVSGRGSTAGTTAWSGGVPSGGEDLAMLMDRVYGSAR